MSTTSDPVVLIRAWFEDGSSVPLRANIRFADESSGGFGASKTVTTPQAAAEVVQIWLEQLVAHRSDEVVAGNAQ